MSEWISIKDRFPENEQNCLVCYDLNQKNEFDGPFFMFAIASFHDDGVYRYWLDSSDYRVLIKLTHWMPLPEEPKGEEE